ncbi:MAG: ornithine cyclodeaminase family protein [Comamonadaceae bacterium]|nr:MAG: ornithine cyclodeaminase family protein [Comamonadaceae bacterium]
MQPAYISADAIAGRLNFTGLIEHLRQAHRFSPPAVERVLMQHKSASGAENGFLIWPAWQHERNLGIKICTLFPDNRSLPAVQALYVLFDGLDGSIQALIDGTELTYWKTAADSALGADYLARKDAKTLLMVGAGNLAPFLIKAYQSIRPDLERVLVWNRTAHKAQVLAQNVRDAACAQAVSDLGEAVKCADIVCCATTSYSPLINGSWLSPGTHVDLIGGYTPCMREADDETVRRSRLFVDSRLFTVEHVGDLTQPIANGVIQRSDIEGDLFDLCTGRCAARRSDSEITLFKSGGGAHLDLMTAQHIQSLLN